VALTNAYANVLQLREHMADDNDVAPEAMLERALNTASRQIDRLCGRKFWLDAAVTVRNYLPREPDIAWVDDIGTTTGLIIATDEDDDGVFERVWDTDDYELEPGDADAAGGAYAWWRIVPVGTLLFPVCGLRKSLRVTAKHGWSSVPPDIEEACLIRAYAIYKRRSSPTGIQGFDGFGMRTTKQDPDFAALIRPYMKITVGAV
jgi:hypothetical protein